MHNGRIALVTGAGSGVGRAASVALARDGWVVVAAGRRLERLDETMNEVTATASGGAAITVDVTDPESVDRLFDQVRADYGRLDLLFNNAGTAASPVPPEQVTFDQWQAVINVNLTGAFLCAQRAFALMKSQDPQGGRIINNGSVSAHAPRPHSAAYTASKHAVTGLTKSLSLDGRAFTISCGQIDIGNALTDMTEAMRHGVAQADGSVAAEATMNVDEVGRAVAYMASLPPEANVLTMTIMASAMPLVGRG